MRRIPEYRLVERKLSVLGEAKITLNSNIDNLSTCNFGVLPERFANIQLKIQHSN